MSFVVFAVESNKNFHVLLIVSYVPDFVFASQLYEMCVIVIYKMAVKCVYKSVICKFQLSYNTVLSVWKLIQM